MIPAVRALAAILCLSAAFGAERPLLQDPDDARETRVLLVPVEGPIGVPTVALIQRALREADSRGVARVVLVVDTPGGELLATKEIQAVLANIRRRDIHTVAWVKSKAWSAGAYIALACSEIFMASNASIGAITPVIASPLGAQDIPDGDARNKAISALRADVSGLVKARKLPEWAGTVAEAMVDPRMVVFEVTYEDESRHQKFAVVEEAGLQELERKGLKIVDKHEFTRRPLTLDAQEAERLGFSRGTFDSFEELVRSEWNLPAEAIGRLEETWSESTVAWLDGMKPVLMVLGFILLLVELKTGMLIAGVLGAVLLGLAFFSSYLVGLASWGDILLFIAGIGLVSVEVFVAPGTLVFGMLGLLCVIAGLILSQQDFVVPANEVQSDILLNNLLNLLYLTLLTVLGAIVTWKLLPRVPILNRAIQAPPSSSATGASTQWGATRGRPGDAELVGKAGSAATDLRPAGIMEIGAERWDVVTEGGFVPRGARVRVVQVKGNRIVVAPLAADDAAGERGQVGLGLLALLLMVGLGLVIAEVFFVSAGILSILAAVALVSSVFLAYTQHGPATGHVFLAVCGIGAPLAIYYALKILPTTGFGKRYLLSGPDAAEVAGAAAEPHLARFSGKTGVAISALRPAGFARIDDQRVDVVTRGEMLEAGTLLRVVEVIGNRVVVARHDAQRASESATGVSKPAEGGQ
jgi:membrane-bound serine protease (ClpP class)